MQTKEIKMKIAIYGQSKDEICKIFSELLTIAKNKNHQIIVETLIQ